jgi:hypothetical protein
MTTTKTTARSDPGPREHGPSRAQRRRSRPSLASHLAFGPIWIAASYAKLIGRQRVKLKNPVSFMLPKYRFTGFSVDKTIRNATYWARQV